MEPKGEKEELPPSKVHYFSLWIIQADFVFHFCHLTSTPECHLSHRARMCVSVCLNVCV